MLNIHNLRFTKKVQPKQWTIVVNCDQDIKLSDHTTLKSFDSGLFKDIEIAGEKLLTIEIGDDFEVSNEMANHCRNNWTPAYEIFPYEIFKDQDFYRSDQIEIKGLKFNYWYCGENFACGIHRGHEFFELHPQILGYGEMQKFKNKTEGSIYYREIVSPGETHSPFFSTDMIYPYHQYKSITKCIWLAIESDQKIPK